MKPLRRYWAHTALVGLSLVWTGCGGSDPSTDASAAPDEAAPVAAAGGGEASAPEAAPGEPTAPSAPTRPAEGEEVAAVEPTPTPAPAPAAGATKGDSSGTSELLALANSTPSGEEPAAADAAPSAQPGPGGAGGRGFSMGPGMPGAPGVTAPGGAAVSAMPAGAPGSAAAYPAGANFPGAPGAGGIAAPPGVAMPGGRGMPVGPGGAIGGGEGALGGGSAASGPFALQIKAVTEFLNAVKAKDKDRLAESVALRSPQEASGERNKKLFAAILEQSISDTELDDIAKSLEGYQVFDTNDAKSSGRLGIILSKTEDGDTFRRTITVRKEAKGWKVLDVGGVGKIDGFSRGGGRTKAKGSR